MIPSTSFLVQTDLCQANLFKKDTFNWPSIEVQSLLARVLRLQHNKLQRLVNLSSDPACLPKANIFQNKHGSKLGLGSSMHLAYLHKIQMYFSPHCKNLTNDAKLLIWISFNCKKLSALPQIQIYTFTKYFQHNTNSTNSCNSSVLTTLKWKKKLLQLLLGLLYKEKNHFSHLHIIITIHI